MSQSLKIQASDGGEGCNNLIKATSVDNVVFGSFLAPGAAKRVKKKGEAKTRYSKSDARYWAMEGKLVFHHSADLQVRLMDGGKREYFPLGSANRKVASVLAAEIWSCVQAEGMGAAIARYKEKDAPVVLDIEVPKVTVGDVIRVVEELSPVRKQTLLAYKQAWRCLVGEMMGIQVPEGMKKKDVHTGGTLGWQKLVEAVPLDSITPMGVQAWKAARLKAAKDPAAVRSATVTVNSILRNAGALFSKKMLPFLKTGLNWEGVVPFAGVSKEKAPSMRYQSRMDARELLKKARASLLVEDLEAYKVIHLGLVVGLRRSEMDWLPWSLVEFRRKVLRMESTEFHQLKSEDSAGEVDLSGETLELLKAWKIDSQGPFVLGDGLVMTRARGYRCERIFKRALVWLRKNGVTGLRPLHTLRKEIGSLIAAEHGIHAASRYLRHADIRITAAVYADKKKAVLPGVLAGL